MKVKFVVTLIILILLTVGYFYFASNKGQGKVLVDKDGQGKALVDNFNRKITPTIKKIKVPNTFDTVSFTYDGIEISAEYPTMNTLKLYVTYNGKKQEIKIPANSKILFDEFNYNPNIYISKPYVFVKVSEPGRGTAFISKILVFNSESSVSNLFDVSTCGENTTL